MGEPTSGAYSLVNHADIPVGTSMDDCARHVMQHLQQTQQLASNEFTLLAAR